MPAAAICLAASAWLVCAPFALGYDNDVARWADVATGMLVAISSTVALTARDRPDGPALLAIGAGLWLVLSVLGLELIDAAVVNRAVSGALITCSGIVRVLP